jgi:hypothetical protein
VTETVSIPITPSLDGINRSLFLSHCRQLAGSGTAGAEQPSPSNIKQLRELARQYGVGAKTEDLKLLVALQVVADLVSQGWKFTAPPNGQVSLENSAGADTSDLKDRIRQAHLIERDAQLGEPAVKEFIQRMERRRLTERGWHSIFSVMRDGVSLAEALRPIAGLPDVGVRVTRLAQVISPYVQRVENGVVCEHTGLLLTDIWRYFRHTWVNAYRSVPGRSMMLLIRDTAAPNHPVIGIAALSSSVVQQATRDAWIGWDAKHSLATILKRPTKQTRTWLTAELQRLLRAIYTKDLLKDGLVSDETMRRPTERALLRLRREAQRAIAKHREFPQKSLHKSARPESDGHNWEERALSSLFRSKRCKTLATLLDIRSTFQECLAGKREQELANAFQQKAVGAALAKLVRVIKAEHVATDMMDITVCGALPPYTHLLGGKLVCTLLCSPEVRHFYFKRYRHQPSVIASSMKGRPVIRKPRLVLLCTTSLYSSGSSQYNRIKIPAEAIGGRAGDVLRYESLGHSQGFGSFHFSRETVGAMTMLVGRTNGGKRVNSIFGEGVNPLLRKIRDALEFAGLPSDILLRHGNRRIVYGVPLARNFRDILLGFSKTPRYIVPIAGNQEATKLLAEYWLKRWLSKRVGVPDILDKVAEHAVTYPVRHGARVPLPPEEFELFASATA